ncbi:MAG: V-type ATP synthase subunit E [Clostridia bacterium]
MAEEQLDKFIETVMNDASQQKNKLIREIEMEKKKQIDKKEEEILQNIYLDIQKQIADIQNKASRLISKSSFDSRRDLLLKREELTNKVFNTLKEKLCEYSNSDLYKEKSIDKIKELLKLYPKEETYLSFNKKDYSELLPKIKLNTTTKTTVDETIFIGGFIFEVPSLNIQYNETLDLKLENQKSVFNEISELSIS